MTTIDAISLTGFLLSIICLSYSAYSDLKIREVSNRVWVIYLPLSVVVLMLKLFFGSAAPDHFSHIDCSHHMSFTDHVLHWNIWWSRCKGLHLPERCPTNQSFFKVTIPLTEPDISSYGPLHNLFSVGINNILRRFEERHLEICQTKTAFRENIGELSILKKLLAVLTGYKTELQTLQKKCTSTRWKKRALTETFISTLHSQRWEAIQ